MKILTSFSLALFSSTLFAATVATGKLSVPKDLSAKAKGIRTVFISIYDAKSPAPMPCAAQKFTLEKDAEGDFLSFTLDSDTVTMMACPRLPETMNLKAKLDRDGSAGRDTTGDIVGTANAIKRGSKDLKISLSTLSP
jgi:hypothetical protein